MQASLTLIILFLEMLILKKKILCVTTPPPFVPLELEPNRKLFPDHISSILDGALVGAAERCVRNCS
ncbi:unnamed protein product, partial [Sphagnum tenellum]